MLETIWETPDGALVLTEAMALGPRARSSGDEKATTWSAVRNQLRVAVLAQGWSDRAGAFTQAFGSDERGLLYRYRRDDGLDGPEGTFLLCTFWLAQALAVTGQIARARVVLDRAAGCATSLGLFSEQIDTNTGELLGNFPQAFSHLGLFTAAHALAEAERTLRPESEIVNSPESDGFSVLSGGCSDGPV